MKSSTKLSEICHTEAEKLFVDNKGSFFIAERTEKNEWNILFEMDEDKATDFILKNSKPNKLFHKIALALTPLRKRRKYNYKRFGGLKTKEDTLEYLRDLYNFLQSKWKKKGILIDSYIRETEHNGAFKFQIEQKNDKERFESVIGLHFSFLLSNELPIAYLQFDLSQNISDIWEEMKEEKEEKIREKLDGWIDEKGFKNLKMDKDTISTRADILVRDNFKKIENKILSSLESLRKRYMYKLEEFHYNRIEKSLTDGLYLIKDNNPIKVQEDRSDKKKRELISNWIDNPRIRKHIDDKVKLYDWMLDESANLNPNAGISTKAIKQMNSWILNVLEGKSIYRSITTDKYEKLLKDIKNGENGLGLSWGYFGGDAIDGNRDHKYEVEFEAQICNPNAIDYFGSYVHHQTEYRIGNGDKEIRLSDGELVKLLKMDIYDNKTKELKETIKLNEKVKISDYYLTTTDLFKNKIKD